ncbi:hypothetical protein C8K36_1011362 [Rhodococcus sp. OK519]|uniref:hypothetical protein n=1 Tax=Rhodococcus sp. OK519 TaxID=2135729 RepID=UPI000D35EC14|nr:hypothetical protein C8K36_1011362 [Rhodococcus sp. OK519]
MSVLTDRPTPDPDFEPEPAAERPPILEAVTAYLRRSGGDASIALGALSVITFWTFGLGIVLGAGAIVSGVVAARARTPDDAEPRSLEPLFGILSGALGVAAGLTFLAVAGPQW